MKTMIARLFGVSLLTALSTSPAMSDPTISIQPFTKTVGPSDVFALDINIATVSDLFAFQFDLGFDPTVLSATGITEGLFLAGGGSTFFIPGTIDNGVGTVSATADSLIGATSGVNGNGTLAEVQFTALAAGMSSITLSNVQLLDSNLSSIPFVTADGSVGVAGAATVPEPSSVLLFAGALVCISRWQSRNLRRTWGEGSTVPHL